MEHESLNRYLEPPPRLLPAAEALPHLGGLTLAPYRGDMPDETEPHVVEPLRDAFDDARAEEMLRRALAGEKVRERLARGKVIPIGVSRRGETAKEERRTYLVVAYDYSVNTAIEISLDESGELLGISDERYQPPPVQSEIDRAVELARADDRIASRVVNRVAMAIPYSGPDGEWSEQRVLEVLFGCRTDRLPQYRAWVDLSREVVLHAGEIPESCE